MTTPLLLKTESAQTEPHRPFATRIAEYRAMQDALCYRVSKASLTELQTMRKELESLPIASLPHGYKRRVYDKLSERLKGFTSADYVAQNVPPTTSAAELASREYQEANRNSPKNRK